MTSARPLYLDTPLRRPGLRAGTKGWIGLAVYVLTYDLLATETMSAAFADAVRRPRRRWRVLLAWSAITAHLFCLIPERADPLRQLARRCGK